MIDDNVAGLTAYAASQLRDGRDPVQVRADLVARGTPAGLADRIVSQAARTNRSRGLRRGALYLVIGAVCLALGGLVTSASYNAAMRTGDVYVVTSGLFGFGIGYSIGGLARLLKVALVGR